MRTQWWAFLVTTFLFGATSQPGDWDGLVKTYIEHYESIKTPAPIAYPQMAKRLKTLFGVRSVGHIQIFHEEDGKKRLWSDIYYKAGEVHIVQHVGGWNLVTKGSEAYEWEVGAKKGVITKQSDKDLIDYLLYVTDPSYILTSLYYYFLYDREKFLPPKRAEQGFMEMRFKKPIEGFQAVFVLEEPLWFGGFEGGNPEGDKKTGRLLLSKPESIKEVPADVFDRLKGIEFKRSDMSIRRHMIYL